MLGTAGEHAYTEFMGDMTFPPQLQQWIEARVAEGRYANAQDYLCDLVRRDQETAQDEIEWLREQIRIGKESGIIDREPEDILEEIIAERRARNN